MEIMNLKQYVPLLLTLLVTTIVIDVSTAPTFDELDRLLQYPVGRFDNNYYIPYTRQPVIRSSYEYDVQRRYYNVDGDAITPVGRNAQRRQDTLSGTTANINTIPDGVRYTPLVRVKQTQTRHKKLFVPNLFG